ncbi:MAG: nucleotidyltransferase family protein [Oscillospiraceae bacterium]|nr:nucleotidyltransferase family protein [Oscillospiraceae bacterium]
MKAIVMAGGEGTRLRSVTGDTPKPMALLAGKPVLEHILGLLARSGVRQVCLTLRYRPECIRDYFGDGSRLGLELCYRVEDAPLGTAGGVRACADFYGREDFLVLSGDAVCTFDLRELMARHRQSGAAVTMALASRETPLQYGTVLTGRDGRVLRFIEKPDWPQVVSDLVNTGIYALSPEAMDFVPEGQPCDFAKELFPSLLEAEQPILGLPMEGYWNDIGTPRAFFQCNLDVLDGKLRLPDATPAAPDRTPETIRRAGDRVLPCRGRARLMRELSCSLMEAGADFDLRDGLTLRAGGDSVHIAPDPDGERLLLRGNQALAARCAGLLRELEKQTVGGR